MSTVEWCIHYMGWINVEPIVENEIVIDDLMTLFLAFFSNNSPLK